MDDDELKAKVSRALERRSLEARRLKTFYFDMAEAADSSVSSVKNWMGRVCAPDAAALLNLFENVPGFEAEVRGTPTNNGDPIAMLETAVDILKDNAREKVVNLGRSK